MIRHVQKIRRNATLGLLLGALLPVPAQAAPLSEADALRLGLGRPEYSAMDRARLGEAEAEGLEAGVWANPVLEFSQEKTGLARETTWQLSQTVDWSGRRGLRQQAAEQRLLAAGAEIRAQAADRAAELRRAFHEVLRQQDHLRAIEAWAARFTGIGNVVEKLAKAGEASGYDRRRLVREQQAAEARQAEARADLDRARARFGVLIGRPASADDGVAGILLPAEPADLADLQRRLAARPDLAARQARAEAANADHAAARRNFPELTLGIGGKQLEEGANRESGTLFSVSLPLPLFERQQGADRRTAAQAQATRAEYALAKQQAEGDLLALHRQVTQLIAAARHYRQQAVQPSTDLIRIAEAAYRAGESSVLELLDAYQGALAAETTALDLEWKARLAGIELDQLTGNHPQ